MWRESITWRLGAVLLSAGAAIPAIAQICLDPLSPLCCPSPCPVIDLGRVPKLLAEVDSLKQSVELDSRVAQSALQMSQAVGGTISAGQALGTQVFDIGSAISGETTARQIGLPANPSAALGVIKQSLFVTAGSPQTASQSRNLAASRRAAAQAEQMGGYALSLSHAAALSTAVSQQAQRAAAAAGRQLHGDIASNSLARMGTYQSLNDIHQLVAAWLSQTSAQSAVTRSTIGGGSAAAISGVPSVPSSYAGAP